MGADWEKGRLFGGKPLYNKRAVPTLRGLWLRTWLMKGDRAHHRADVDAARAGSHPPAPQERPVRPPTSRRRGGCAPILKQTFIEWREDRVPRLGAALAFYSFFSLGPLLVIAMVIAGWSYAALGHSAASQQQVREQLQAYVGSELAGTLDQLMQSASRSRAGTLATLAGILGIVFGATGAVVALKDALNTVWGVEAASASWWWTIYDYARSLVIVLLVGALLIASSILTAVLWSMARLAQQNLPFPLPAAQAINLAVSFVIITALFAAVYRLLPDVAIGWRDVIQGAALACGLFLIGKHLFALYVSYVGLRSAYGTAGSFAVLLLFIYYSAQIFLFGAEFTQVYARERGAHVQPRRGARRVTEAARANTAAHRKIDRHEAAQDPQARPQS
jgi:membrane protein